MLVQLGPVPQKMVKFNPEDLKAKFQARFSCLRTFNSRLQNTVEPLLQDTVMTTQNITLSNA